MAGESGGFRPIVARQRPAIAGKFGLVRPATARHVKLTDHHETAAVADAAQGATGARQRQRLRLGDMLVAQNVITATQRRRRCTACCRS